jgi:DNA-binding protein YbaB
VYGSQEEALAQIDRAVAQAQERVTQARAYQAELEGMRVVGQSRDGTAEVTLGHTGAVLDVYLGRSLQDAGLDRIRAVLLEANSAAQAQLAEQVTELTGRTFGRDSGTTREIAAQYRQMFPPPDDTGPGAGQGGVLR